MSRTLPSYAITEKNKIAGVGAFINLVQLDISGEGALRFALSQSDVVWGGNTYSAMPMQIGDINESLQGRVETSQIKISNVDRTLEPYLQTHDGAAGSVITITVVHSENLTETDPVTEDAYDIIETQADEQWVTFTVGGVSPFKRRFPRDRYISTVCRHFFKGPLCLYTGADATCDHTVTDCQTKGNEAQYGGSPGISEGVYG